MARDSVTIGNLRVASQVIGMADTVDVPLLDTVPWDGIVGLALPDPSLSESGVTPLFDSALNQGLLNHPYMGST